MILSQRFLFYLLLLENMFVVMLQSLQILAPHYFPHRHLISGDSSHPKTPIFNDIPCA